MDTIDSSTSQEVSQHTNQSLLKRLLTKKILLPVTVILLVIGTITGIWLLHSHSGIPFLQNTAWNNEKAAYLARRVYLNPTIDDVKKLSSASSAQDAVNMIFAPVSQTDEQQYQQGLQNLVNNRSTYKNENIYEDTV